MESVFNFKNWMILFKKRHIKHTVIRSALALSEYARSEIQEIIIDCLVSTLIDTLTNKQLKSKQLSFNIYLSIFFSTRKLPWQNTQVQLQVTQRRPLHHHMVRLKQVVLAIFANTSRFLRNYLQILKDILGLQWFSRSTLVSGAGDA